MTRLRDLGIVIGDLPPGRHNAITDVPGVWVGHATLNADTPRVVRTGVTVVTAFEDRIWDEHAACGWHRFNGNGELTGIPWMEESGLLGSAIGLTNTHQVGMVRDRFVAHAIERGHDDFLLPVVAETYDGWLSDIDAFALEPSHVNEALAAAGPGPVAEGNVGGGTGMICHEFKGGIGTSSRIVAGTWTVGVLVQANYGRRSTLRLDGLPVGRVVDHTVVPSAYVVEPTAGRGPERNRTDGSIIGLIATDAPLLPVQCRRMAQRATVGLARAGGVGHNGSGDLFVAFSTGNRFPANPHGLLSADWLPHRSLDPLFDAVADATEEAIGNALTAADTMAGRLGRVAHSMPHDRVVSLAARFRA